MTGKDPFAEPDDIDATVMRPMAFHRSAAPAATPPTPPHGFPPPPTAAATANSPPLSASGPAPSFAAAGGAAMDDGVLAALASLGQNPLLSTAAPILALVVRVRDLPTHRDVDSLRERVIAEMHRFETTAIQAGLTADQIRIGRYALCATIDDVVLATPWGGQSVWATKSLVSTIHRETWGGERFFDLLEQMVQEPRRYLSELELFYACLSLGFEGRYRVTPRGYAELARLRDALYRAVRRERGDFERELSPHWRGIADRYRPLGAVVPLWVIGAVLAALLMFLYMWFAYALGERTDGVQARMATLLPDRPVEIARLTPPPVRAVPAVPAPSSALQRIGGFLDPEVKAGQVEVLAGNSGGVVVRVVASLFLSGSDTVDAKWRPLIDKVGQAVAAEKGPIEVVGHTDNVPIRSIRFPSNQELSVARAEMVAGLIGRVLGSRDRLGSEGRGDTEPIASNATPQGRQQNRRIEVILEAP